MGQASELSLVLDAASVCTRGGGAGVRYPCSCFDFIFYKKKEENLFDNVNVKTMFKT